VLGMCARHQSMVAHCRVSYAGGAGRKFRETRGACRRQPDRKSEPPEENLSGGMWSASECQQKMTAAQKKFWIGVLLVSCAVAQDRAGRASVRKVTTSRQGSDLRIEITVSLPVRPSIGIVANPNRILLDFPNTICNLSTKNITVHFNGVRQLRTAQHSTNPFVTRIVLDVDELHPYALTTEGNRVILTVSGEQTTTSRSGPVAATSGDVLGSVFRRHRDSNAPPAPPSTVSGPTFNNSSALPPAWPPVAAPDSTAQQSSAQNQNVTAATPAKRQELTTSPSPTLAGPAIPRPEEKSIETAGPTDSVALAESTSTPQAPMQEPNSDQQTRPSNLETGGPLRVVMSPFRWGRLSLVSLTAYQGYDTNVSLQKSGKPTEFSALNALLVYSVTRDRWSLDFQYEPSAVITPDTIEENVTANSVDLQVSRPLSPTWTFTGGEYFHYTPNVASSIQGNSLALNLGGGISIQLPYLRTSQSVLLNSLSGSVDHRINEHSSVTFYGGQGYIRLTPVAKAGQVGVGEQATESVNGNSGVSYSRTLNLRDTIGLSYDYRVQSSPSFARLGQFHVASVSWGHILAPGLRMGISGGPGFWDAGTAKQGWRTTLQGLFQITKEGYKGSIGISYIRNNSFNGVIGNTFGNIYAVTMDRRFTSRFRVSAQGSYLQQQIVGGQGYTGTSAAIEPAWLLSRNWSVFGQVRYLRTEGNQLAMAPEKVVTVGVRWAWVPEKP